MISRSDHVGIEIADMRTQDSDASPTFQKLKYKKWKGVNYGFVVLSIIIIHSLYYVIN